MARRVCLLTNPKGGVGDNLALASRAGRWLGDRGIDVALEVTTHAGHARGLVRDLPAGSADAIVGIGGDGTFSEMVEGMMARPADERLPVALLPGGTGNSFLYDLGCLDPDEGMRRIAAGHHRSIDLFELEVAGRRHHGFNIAGWGLFSAANVLAESLRPLGRRRYDLAGLLHVALNRRYRATLRWDGEEWEEDFTLVVAANTVHSGEAMRLAPRALLDDGLLDLLVVGPASRRELLRLFAGLRSGRHVGRPGVRYLQVTEFAVETEEAVPVNLDGDLVESGSFRVRVLPGALDILL